MGSELNPSGEGARASPEVLARLFRQIRIATRREAAVFRAFRRRFGFEVADAAGIDEKDFEARERGENLEALLGAEDVPVWLREALGRQVRSEAILLSHLLRRYGEEGWQVARRAYREFGRECGQDAQKRRPGGKTEDLLAALEEDHLHGLPNQAPGFVLPCPGGFEVRRAHCPCQRAWDVLGAPAQSLCDLDGSWVDGFCMGFGAPVRHRTLARIVRGANECRDVFVNKRGASG